MLFQKIWVLLLDIDWLDQPRDIQTFQPLILIYRIGLQWMKMFINLLSYRYDVSLMTLWQQSYVNKKKKSLTRYFLKKKIYKYPFALVSFHTGYSIFGYVWVRFKAIFLPFHIPSNIKPLDARSTAASSYTWYRAKKIDDI